MRIFNAEKVQMEVCSFNQADIGLLPEIQPPDWSDISLPFNFYNKAAFCCPIKVVTANKMVGIGCSIMHNNVAWLAHIIVHPDYRNRGIGRLVTEKLVELSQARGCETINLIATDLGAPVYEKVGFVTDTEYIFYKDIRPNPAWLSSEFIQPINESHHNGIAELDHRISLEDRMFHLSQYFVDGYVYTRNNEVHGYYLPSFGEGLLLATEEKAGFELMKLRLQTKNNASFPVGNLHATRFLNDLNYKEFKRAKRMRLGRKIDFKFDRIYNRIGGNLG